jgi:hypothetical protein
VKLTVVGKSGSLHQFIRKQKNKKGVILYYPKVIGSRKVSNPFDWEWQWSYKEKVENKWKTICVRVHPSKAIEVKELILKRSSISQIQAFLNS